jgi:DMSO reductase anchor subunit
MIIFTTLAGAGQGLLLGLIALDLAVHLGLLAAPPGPFFLAGAVSVLVLAGAGLVAATFHLGHPLRAWRAMSQWRTSWLSREVIVLPAFMAVVFAWGLAHYAGKAAAVVLGLGLLAAVLAVVLFVCTGMIYAAVSVIREWASPLTPLNFGTLGLASGLTLCTVLAGVLHAAWLPGLATAAALATAVAAVTRAASTWRNAKLAPKTTMQTAIGVRHPRIVQHSQGAMGGSFNTREYFHGASEASLTRLRWAVALTAFGLPMLLLGGGGASVPVAVLVLLAALQYAGLLGERWLFFAEGRHPQNLYYQRVS